MPRSKPRSTPDTTAQKWWYYLMPLIALGLTRATMSGADWSATWAWIGVFVAWFFALAALGVAVETISNKRRA